MPLQARKIALHATVILGVLIAVGAEPSRSQRVLVISPEWLGYPNPAAVIAAAEGAIVSIKSSGVVAVGFSDAPGFVQRLYSAGALLVWDGSSVSGCEETKKGN